MTLKPLLLKKSDGFFIKLILHVINLINLLIFILHQYLIAVNSVKH